MDIIKFTKDFENLKKQIADYNKNKFLVNNRVIELEKEITKLNKQKQKNINHLEKSNINFLQEIYKDQIMFLKQLFIEDIKQEKV